MRIEIQFMNNFWNGDKTVLNIKDYCVLLDVAKFIREGNVNFPYRRGGVVLERIDNEYYFQGQDSSEFIVLPFIHSREVSLFFEEMAEDIKKRKGADTLLGYDINYYYGDRRRKREDLQ